MGEVKLMVVECTEESGSVGMGGRSMDEAFRGGLRNRPCEEEEHVWCSFLL